MTKRRSRRNRRPQIAEVGIIDPYKVTNEDALAEGLDAFDGEPPVFSVPGLDEILANTEKEAEQMMRIYKL